MKQTVTTKKQDIRIAKKPDQTVIINAITCVDKKTASVITIDYDIAH